MRDWNQFFAEGGEGGDQSFDLTYEGLKCIQSFRFPLSFLCFDLTYEGLKYLVHISFRQHIIRFWSYLWGIEIWLIAKCLTRQFRFDLTYEGLKFRSRCLFQEVHQWVLILPMRDWNKSSWSTARIVTLVLILPMRDWNLPSLNPWWSSLNCFDLTHEGLKCFPRV